MTEEDKIADLKANFDYVLEGKDLEIKELGERCNQLLKDKGDLTDRLSEEVELHLRAEDYIKSLEKENKTLEGCLLAEQEHTQMLEKQIEKMKVCSNCKHFNKAEDNEYCWNCERHLVNSLDNLKAEEIIKDEWELKND